MDDGGWTDRREISDKQPYPAEPFTILETFLNSIKLVYLGIWRLKTVKFLDRM